MYKKEFQIKEYMHLVVKTNMDGSIVFKWPHNSNFIDEFELTDYKIFNITKYSYYENGRGIIRVNESDGIRYLKLIKLDENTVIRDNYNILINRNNYGTFKYKKGILVKVKPNEGDIIKCYGLDDYSYYIKKGNFVNLQREYFVITHDDKVIKAKNYKNGYKFEDQQGNIIACPNFVNLQSVLKTHEKFDDLILFLAKFLFY